MPSLKLRLRNLETGEPAVGEHPDIDAAMAWLRERPRFVEVLGVLVDGITREESDRMRGAMRPLDPDEAARAKALDAADAAEAAERAAARQRENEESAARARDAARTADPNRPIELVYRYDAADLAKTDPLDDRPITDAARAAALEFVREREEWVRDRGQMVGEAKVTVYPNDVPAKKSRVVTGSFVPVTAHAKSELN